MHNYTIYRLCLCGVSLLMLLPGTVEAQEMDVTEFVQQIYFEGIPYDAANRYGAEDAPKLLALLEDSSQTAYWANAIVTLCIIGNSDYVGPILDFIKSDDGTLTDEVYRAKSSAVMALGYHVNKSGDQRALDYLVESANPNSWTRREVRYMGPYQRSAAERNTNLSTMAILGLALSGHPTAAEALRTMSPEGFEAMTTSDVRALTQSALEAHGRIAEAGLSAYYKNAQAGR